jgi:hypothetical protein
MVELGGHMASARLTAVGLAVVLVLLPVVSSAANAKVQRAPDRADVDDGDEPIFGFGGSVTCGHWLSSPSTKQRGNDWILGWWAGSAEGDDDNHLSAEKATEKQILDRTSRLCRMNPDWGLRNAAAHIYVELTRGKSRRERPR